VIVEATLDPSSNPDSKETRLDSSEAIDEELACFARCSEEPWLPSTLVLSFIVAKKK